MTSRQRPGCSTARPLPVASKSRLAVKRMWRRGWDSNPRYGLSPYNGLANRRLQPLGHPSTDQWIDAVYARRPLARAHQAAQDGLRRAETELAPLHRIVGITPWHSSPPIRTRFVAIVRRSAGREIVVGLTFLAAPDI